METQIDLTTSASRFTRQILLDMKEMRANNSFTGLSNVELLLLLAASGSALSRDEIRGITRDFLLDRAPAISKANGFAEIGRGGHEEAVDRFLEDLLDYAASDELQVAIAEGISEERYAHMRAEFVRRMEMSGAAGLRAADPELRANASSGHARSGLSLPPIPGLCATAIAFAFCSWMAVDAQAQVGGSGRPQGAHQRSQSVRSAAPAKASPEMRKQLRSLDSSDAQERAIALDWFASLGPNVPAEIRSRLRDRLTSNDPLLRGEAAWLIANITLGSPDDVKALTAALQDPDRRVHSAAALGLGRIGPAASSALPMLRKRSGQDFATAIDGIGRRSAGTTRRIEALLEQRSPLLQLMFERQIDQERQPMGMCMCSFLAAEA